MAGLKQVPNIVHLMNDAKTEPPGVHVLFPDGLHKYVKANDGEGTYTLRFDNGLGARVWYEVPGFDDRIHVQAIRWDRGSLRITDYNHYAHPSIPIDGVPDIPALAERLETIAKCVPYPTAAEWTPNPALSTSKRTTGLTFPAAGAATSGPHTYDATTHTWKTTSESASGHTYTVTYTPEVASAVTPALKWEDPA